MDFSIKVDWKKRVYSFSELRQINRNRKFCIESLFLRFSVTNVALKNALSDGRRRQDTED